ncbi:MAG: DUF1499 domain-containing protein [Deltaproteobacteria bacterium]|nr:DUF1499 domain-containing protein [Deltaproteobacteria bacterium]
MNPLSLFKVVYGTAATLVRDLTQHEAHTDEEAFNPVLRTRHYAEPPEVLWNVLSQLIMEKFSHWGLESRDSVRKTIHATRQTPTFRFTDDVRIEIQPNGVGSMVDAKSSSRVGIADFGQNRRNIVELFNYLDTELDTYRRFLRSGLSQGL